MGAAVARHQAGRPRSRFFETARRIADRFGPLVAASYVEAILRLQAGIDDVELRSAIASGNLRVIESAVGASRLRALFLGGDSLAEQLRRTAAATGTAGADVLSGVTGLEVGFNAVHPNVVMFARRQAAELVASVTEDVREAIRIVVAAGQTEGLTTVQQARAIREVVGLPPNWAEAPLNLARELREGRFTTSRRLSAIEKAQIKKRLREGTLDEAFIERMEKRYAESLTNRRALNIARTETQRAAMHGQREGWKQARDQGALPDTARRMWIVTPDDRLRATHAAIPGMNPDGVPLDGVFETPLGPSSGPPLEVNCRCGEGLIFVDERPSDSGEWRSSLEEEFEPVRVQDSQGRRDAVHAFRARFVQEFGDNPEAMSYLSGVDRWIMGSRQADLLSDMEQVFAGAQGKDDARALLRAISQSPPGAPALYRGIWSGDPMDRVIDRYRTGTVFDLRASSFSTDRDVASKFAGWGEDEVANPVEVIFHLERGARATKIENLSFHWDEREWITGGRFEVTTAGIADGKLKIGLRQLGVFDVE